LPEFKNPNLQTQGSSQGSGGGDSRGLLAFTFLALVLLLGYQFFVKPKPAPPAPAAQQQAQNQTQQPAQPSAAGQPQLAAGSVQTPSGVAAITAAVETETTVENDSYKLVFTNRGAQVKHWILKHYFDTAGKPLDMVQAQAAARFGLPLSLFTYEPALTTQLNQALYQVTASGAPLTTTGHAVAPATNALTFHYAANGLDVLKTFRFDATYVLTIETEVRRNGTPVRALVEWPAGLGDMEEFGSAHGLSLSVVRQPSQFSWSLNGKEDSVAAAKVSHNATIEQPYEFAGITDLYFTAAFLPDSPAGTSVVTFHNTIDLPSDLSDPTSKPSPTSVLGLAAGDTSGYTRLRLYAGPKQMDVLKTIHTSGPDGKPTGPTLESLIQFGWLTVIAKPLYLALRFLHTMLGAGSYTWGWAIIIVTVLFNVLLLPTRIMMMRSSLKMMRIQPKVEALKKRYSQLKMNDPKRAEMNTEMMTLYKTEGVNMYGGCLPMLLQMPLFFAYYRVLLNAVELRQAHWFWLTDLSSPDPLHILPILIIGSMFLVQFITPSPGMDPAQRRMMAIMMPVIFGFSMWHFASGLALYWGTGNIINLAIQIGINQSSIGKEMHAIAAKRAAKKAGGNQKVLQGKR
jgi:YidC/Oxa1 family membrane protein insertase